MNKNNYLIQNIKWSLLNTFSKIHIYVTFKLFLRHIMYMWSVVRGRKRERSKRTDIAYMVEGN